MASNVLPTAIMKEINALSIPTPSEPAEKDKKFATKAPNVMVGAKRYPRINTNANAMPEGGQMGDALLPSKDSSRL